MNSKKSIADVYTDSLSIRVNTHGLLGVPSEESVKDFINSVWNINITGWKLKSSEEKHYEVFEFMFEIEDDNYLKDVSLVKQEVSKLTIKHLKPNQWKN